MKLNAKQMKKYFHNFLCVTIFFSYISPSYCIAGDSTSFDPRDVSVIAKSISSIPVGTIITWPVATNPEGWDEGKWLECNGQTISQTVYPELFALVGSRVPELRGRNVSYSGTTTPGQVAADNKGWFRVMWNTWGTGNNDDFAYVFDLSTPIGGGTPSHQGNNVYKYHDHKSGESGHDVTVLWFPVGGTGTETMEVRYLMRALP